MTSAVRACRSPPVIHTMPRCMSLPRRMNRTVSPAAIAKASTAPTHVRPSVTEL